MLAGVERFELSTCGFGDRVSTALIIISYLYIRIITYLQRPVKRQDFKILKILYTFPQI